MWEIKAVIRRKSNIIFFCLIYSFSNNDPLSCAVEMKLMNELFWLLRARDLHYGEIVIKKSSNTNSVQNKIL